MLRPKSTFDVSPLSELPDEIALYIFSYLTFVELYLAALIITKEGIFPQVAGDISLWESLFQSHFPHLYSKWKEYYSNSSNSSESDAWGKASDTSDTSEASETSTDEDKSLIALRRKKNWWLDEFLSVCDAQYENLERVVRKQFILIKDNDLERLKMLPITFDDLQQVDASKISSFNWVKRVGNPALLDYLYEHPITKRYSDATGTVLLPDVVDNEENTIGHWAVRYLKPPNTIESLISQGLNIHFLSNMGDLLHLAAQENLPDMLEYLLKQKMNINSQSLTGSTALLFASALGHFRVVTILLQSNADTTIPLREDCEYHSKLGISQGDTPLHASAHQGSLPVLRALLARGANVHATNGELTLLTPLHKAVEAGHLESAKELLKQHADINARTAAGATALLIATKNGDKKMVELLLQWKANPDIPLETDIESNAELGISAGDTNVHIAIKLGHEKILKCLVNAGANIFSRSAKVSALELANERRPKKLVSFLNILIGPLKTNPRPSVDGYRELFQAVERGRELIVIIFLNLGYDINARNEFGATLLLLSIIRRDCNMFFSLLTSHKDINLNLCLEDPTHHYLDSNVLHGYTALHAITSSSSTTQDDFFEESFGMINLIIKCGANVNAKTPDGDTALHLAIKTSNFQFIKILISQGADLSMVNANGDNAFSLILKICGINPKIYASFDSNNINSSNRFGATLLHLAIMLGHHQLVLFLLALGADPEIRLKDPIKHYRYLGAYNEDTSFHIATRLQGIDLLRPLLGAGAKVETLTKKGRTALHLGSTQRHPRVSCCLIGLGVDIDTRATDTGATSLLLAVLHGQNNVVKALLKNRADPTIGLQTNCTKMFEIRISIGDTPIHVAVRKNNEVAFNHLIKANVGCIKLANSEGKMPLDLAKKYTNIYYKLKLLDLYVSAAFSDGKKKSSLPFFQKTDPIVCSRVAAIKALIDFLFNGANPKILSPHQKMIEKDDDLKLIYKHFLNPIHHRPITFKQA